MTSLWRTTDRGLTWFHRWAGVVLCLIFSMWFASGAVLHFVAFPSLSSHDRHRGGIDLDFAQVALSPGEAMTRLPGSDDLRLLERAGHAAYLGQTSAGWTAVGAASGALLPDVTPTEAVNIAGLFGGASVAAITGPFAYDQWIVHQHFDPYRPFYRVRLDDTDRTDLYVSARTGEVLQRTRFAARAWNWVGAVVHWIYFTPLRQSWTAWNQVVWWLSLVALLSSVAGTWLGFVRTLANRAAGRKAWSPFRGWMRWHHLIGLFASVVVITWMSSGWLSMDHGRIFSMGHPSEAQVLRLSGMTVRDAARAVTLDSLRKMAPAAEITFNAIDDKPFLTAYQSHTGNSRIAFLNEPSNVVPLIPNSVLLAGVRRVWPDARAAAPLVDSDALYRQAEAAGEEAAGFIAGQDGALRAYIDGMSGRFLVVMDRSRREYAWIYYALHTFKLPGLIEHPTLRTIVVVFLLALGFVSSATGVVLGVKRLQRNFP